ncbi:MAG TPA: carboxymuconolactone decarboxylase family protein [Alphaproteobacteria bacterium]|nr:carboxymuconolactone decarboxylase family protein [Alphaproteobacteria bacterium]
MTRLPLLAPGALNDAQRKIYDAITKGPRTQNTPRSAGISLDTPGGLPGPFNAWMYSPVIGNLTQELGAALRFSNSLPNNLLEIAVMMVGKHWSAQFEFWAHARLARAAGVSDAIIEAIRTGAEPQFDKSDENQIYLFAREFLDTKRVSDATYAATRALIGENGLVDLIMLMGYYTIVSMTLNCFQVPLPQGQNYPFEEPASA